MPRTKARKVQNKRNRNSDNDSNMVTAIKEAQRAHDEFENKMMLQYQARKEELKELFESFRVRVGVAELEKTMEQLTNGESATVSDSFLTDVSGMSLSSHDDGYVTASSVRSLKGKKLGPLASAMVKSRRRSVSASNVSKTSNHTLSRTTSRNDNTTGRNDTTTRASRSKFRTPAARLQTMSADRTVMQPVTPKIQLNTPITMLRYPKFGETIMSMSGSPVIVNGGAQQGTANINIPIPNGMFSLQPNAMNSSAIDTDLISRIDLDTITQLKQLQANLAVVMNTVSKMKKN